MRKLCAVDDRVIGIQPEEMVSLDSDSLPPSNDLVNSSLLKANGLLLVYSITSRHSYNVLVAFCQQILNGRQKVPLASVVIGNKCDLENSREVPKKGTIVPMGCCVHRAKI